MGVTPTISLVAYEARDGRVFVKVPNERGRYILTERCVVEVDCWHCKSAAGEPCFNGNIYTVATHSVRRNRASRNRARGGKFQQPDRIEAKPRVKLLLDRPSVPDPDSAELHDVY